MFANHYARSVSGLLSMALFLLTLRPSMVTKAAGEVSRIIVLSHLNLTKITAYSLDGKPVGPAVPLGQSYPNGLAVDAAGNALYANCDPSNHVRRFDMKGTSAPLPVPVGCVFGIAVDHTGKLYLLTSDVKGKNILKIFTPEGEAAGPTISTETQAARNDAQGITVDANGKIYVVFRANNLLKTFDASGQPAEPTIKGLYLPHAVAVAPNGTIYVVNNFAVRSYGQDGKATPVVIARTHQGGGADLPRAVVVDSAGRIYVGWSGTVGIYQPDGKLIREFATEQNIYGIAVY